MTKDEINKQAITILKLRGCKVWRQNNVRAVKGRSFVGLKGVPDVLAISSQGLFVGCEVKAEGDKLSHEQVDFLTDLKQRGGIALIARNEGNEVIIEDFDPARMLAGKIIKSLIKKAG